MIENWYCSHCGLSQSVMNDALKCQEMKRLIQDALEVFNDHMPEAEPCSVAIQMAAVLQSGVSDGTK